MFVTCFIHTTFFKNLYYFKFRIHSNDIKTDFLTLFFFLIKGATSVCSKQSYSKTQTCKTSSP